VPRTPVCQNMLHAFMSCNNFDESLVVIQSHASICSCPIASWWNLMLAHVELFSGPVSAVRHNKTDKDRADLHQPYQHSVQGSVSALGQCGLYRVVIQYDTIWRNTHKAVL